MKRILATCLAAIGLVLAACGERPQNSTPTTDTPQIGQLADKEQIAAEPQISIVAKAGDFVKFSPITLEITVTSPVKTGAELLVSTGSLVELKEKKYPIQFSEGETKTVKIKVTPLRAGFHEVMASVQFDNWRSEKIVSATFGFEALSDKPEQRGNKRGGPKTAEEHRLEIPVAQDDSAYHELVKANLEGRDNLPLEINYKNYFPTGTARKTAADGTQATGATFTEAMIPNTGSGKPLPGEMENTPIKKSSNIKPQGLNCGSSWASVQYNIKNYPDYDGSNFYGGYYLKQFKVTVMDYNGVWGFAQIASGFTDSNGRFDYIQPNCDTSSWFDYSGPDLVFKIEALTTQGLDGGVPWSGRASAITGVFWEDTSTSHFFSLTAQDSEHYRVMWINTMLQLSMNANYLAGGNGEEAPFPLFTTYKDVGTFSPVGRILFGDTYGPGEWSSPYPVVHEFGHQVMWRTADTVAYAQGLISYGIKSPGYMDEWCNPYINYWPITSIPGLAAYADCMSKIYNHEVTKTYHPRLGWQEGWANYFDTVMYIYLYQTTRDKAFLKASKFNVNQAYCQIPLAEVCKSFPIQAVIPSGIGNELRVSSFLFRYTAEVLAGLPTPNQYNLANSITIEDWFKDLNLGQANALLRAYGRVRSSLSGYGYVHDLYDAWRDRIKNTVPTGTGARICQIADESGVAANSSHPFNCNQ
jgi:hypothetical protein